MTIFKGRGAILPPEMKTALWVVLCLLINARRADSACSFPTDLQSASWTSTNFGTVTVTTNQMTVTSPTVEAGFTWECHLTEGTQYVIKTVTTATPFSFTGYYYHCLDLTKQNANSYLYYLQTTSQQTVFLETTTTVTAVSTICTQALSGPEFNVMVKVGNEADAKQTCVDPLHGDFYYTFSDSSNRCGASPGTGRLATCSNTATVLTSDHTACTYSLAYSASGVVYCVASRVSGSTYYQTVYNTDTTLGAGNYRFTCMALTMSSGADGNITTSVSQKPTNCESGQTSTVKPTGGALATLTSYATCVVTTTTDATATTQGQDGVTQSPDNTALIVGVTVGVVALVGIVVAAILIYYFCFREKEPDNIIHVEENAKPKFEDETRHTPLTRDDIGFDLESPSETITSDYMNGNLVGTIPTGSPLNTSGNDVNLSGRFSGMAANSIFTSMNGKPAMTSNGHAPGITNGYVTPEMSFREKPGDKTPPGRPSLKPGRETMVIFNGDEKVLAGNDSRVVSNGGPQGSFRRPDNGNFVRMSSIDENNTTGPYQGDMSPSNRETVTFPSMPREKSNLMPPIETSDPEKDSFSPRPNSNGR